MLLCSSPIPSSVSLVIQGEYLIAHVFASLISNIYIFFFPHSLFISFFIFTYTPFFVRCYYLFCLYLLFSSLLHFSYRFFFASLVFFLRFLLNLFFLTCFVFLFHLLILYSSISSSPFLYFLHLPYLPIFLTFFHLPFPSFHLFDLSSLPSPLPFHFPFLFLHLFPLPHYWIHPNSAFPIFHSTFLHLHFP